MTILFFGRTQGNSGPDNVNRAYDTHLSSRFLRAEPGGGIPGLLRDLGKLLRCRVLVVSGLSRKGCILMGAAKLLGRKTLYMMHGCAKFEREVNHLRSERPLRQERFLMGHCDRILAVSRRYREWLAERYPQHAEKLDFLNPGIPELPPRDPEGKRIPGSILAAGADREIKNNLPLARAVEELGGGFHLEVCGAGYHGNPFANFQYSRYLGLLSQEDYWAKLRQTELFVVNSTVESFGLSALEALSCGCSLLVSENAGVCDLLELQEKDIIYDPLDTEELKNKIRWLQAHPNHARLRARKWTHADAAAALEAICFRLEGGNP